MARLEYVLNGQAYTLEVPPTGLVIGREATDGAVAIPTDLLSRKHFSVQPRGGVFVISDMGSSNGTLLDGMKLTQNPLPLKHGAKIVAGGMTFIFNRDEAQQQSAAGAPGHQAPAANLTGLPSVQLHLLDDAGNPIQSIRLGASSTIGRDNSCTLQVDHVLISGTHASIELRNGQYLLSDLGSSNGTWVGVRQVQQKVLRKGDIITLSQAVRLAFDDPQAFHKAGGAEGLIAMRDSMESAVPDSGSVWTKAMLVGSIIAVVLAAAGFVLPKVMYKEAAEVRALPTSGLTSKGTLSFEGGASVLQTMLNTTGKFNKIGLDKGFADTGEQCLLVEATSGDNSLEIHLPALTVNQSLSLEVSVAVLGEGSSIGTSILELEDPKTRQRIQFLDRVVSFRPKGDAWTALKLKGNATGNYEGWEPVLRFKSLVGLLRFDSAEVKASASGQVPASLKTSKGRSLIRSGENQIRISSDGAPEVSVEFLSLDDRAASPTSAVVAADAVTSDDSSFAWEQRYRLTDDDTLKTLMLRAELPGSGRKADKLVLTASRKGADMKGRFPAMVRITGPEDKAALFDYFLNQTNVSKATKVAVGNIGYVRVGGVSLNFDPPVVVVVESVTGGRISLSCAPVPPGAALLHEHLRVVIDEPEEPKLALYRLVEAEARILMQPPTRHSKPNYSAALQRALWLKEQRDIGFEELRQRGEALEQEIEDRRKADAEAVYAAYESARRRNAPLRDIDVGLKSLAAFLESWPDDRRIEEFNGNYQTLLEVKDSARASIGLAGSGLRSQKPSPPALEKELLEDEAKAARFLALAKKSHEEGNWLFAFVLVDNLGWNYHYTKSADEANALAEKIKLDWANRDERREFVGPLLEYAQSLEYLDGNLSELREVLRKIIRRYPRSEEAAAAKQKLIVLGG